MYLMMYGCCASMLVLVITGAGKITYVAFMMQLLVVKPEGIVTVSCFVVWELYSPCLLYCHDYRESALIS